MTQVDRQKEIAVRSYAISWEATPFFDNPIIAIAHASDKATALDRIWRRIEAIAKAANSLDPRLFLEICCTPLESYYEAVPACLVDPKLLLEELAVAEDNWLMLERWLVEDLAAISREREEFDRARIGPDGRCRNCGQLVTECKITVSSEFDRDKDHWACQGDPLVCVAATGWQPLPSGGYIKAGSGDDEVSVARYVAARDALPWELLRRETESTRGRWFDLGYDVRPATGPEGAAEIMFLSDSPDQPTHRVNTEGPHGRVETLAIIYGGGAYTRSAWTEKLDPTWQVTDGSWRSLNPAITTRAVEVVAYYMPAEV